MMSEEELKHIYENAKKNSVGSDKVSSTVRYKTQAVLKKSIAVILALFIAASCAGCGLHQSTVTDEQRTKIEEEYAFLEEDESGYSAAEVGVYEKLRAMDLLDDNNMTDYEAKGPHRDYHYTALDYAEVEGLDESYLYGFYVLSNEEDANEMAKALGYANLDDYMIQNGYVDENGKPSMEEWCRADIINMREIMVSEYGAKGDHK